MKILFIGGTRLLGKKIVELFIANGDYNLTILSRKAGLFSDECSVIVGDRSETLKEIEGQHYDFIFDFIAYTPENVREVTEKLTFNRYIFISSVWLQKLNPSNTLDQFVETVNLECLKNLPVVTQEYLVNKQQSELYLRNNLEKGKFVILRLPIFFGYHDHTGRLEFYISRLLDNKPILMINGGKNICQIAFVDDLASVLLKTFVKNQFSGYDLLEALPTEGISVADLIQLMKQCTGSQSELLGLPADTICEKLPEYAEQEPLWRERYMAVSNSNIFSLSKENSTPFKTWIKDILPSINIGKQSYLRGLELNLIQEIL